MSFGRTYDIERGYSSQLASEVEEALKKHLNEQNFSPNSSAYYIDQIKSAMGGQSNGFVKNMTVADMVNDLMKRTGLSQYIEEIKASENIQQSKTAQTLTLLNVPELKESVENYIKNRKAFQTPAVLDWVKGEKSKLDSSLPKDLVELDPADDEPLINFIEQTISANKINDTILDDGKIEDSPSTSSVLGDELSWAKT